MPGLFQFVRLVRSVRLPISLAPCKAALKTRHALQSPVPGDPAGAQSASALHGKNCAEIGGALLGGLLRSRRIHPCGGLFQCFRPQRPRFFKGRVSLIPSTQIATLQVLQVIPFQFAEAAPCHIRQIHLQFFACGAVFAALANILVPAARRLHHLVEVAILYRDITFTKAASIVITQLRHLIRFQFAKAAVSAIYPPRRFRTQRLPIFLLFFQIFTVLYAVDGLNITGQKILCNPQKRIVRCVRSVRLILDETLTIVNGNFHKFWKY